MSRDGPATVWLDPRIAARLPESEENALENLAGPDVKPIAYLRKDLAEKAIRESDDRDAEILVMIQAVGSILYGLSNHGRLFAFGVAEGVDGWHEIAAAELAP